jgi:hypothetical protein
MYIHEEMIDLGLPEGGNWTSNDHRIVAQNILLSNPQITTREALMQCTKIINDIPQDKIRTVLFSDLYALGIPLP